MSDIAVGLFGVPGVGKSTLLAAHVGRETRDAHVSGSSVIKAIIAPASVRDLDQWSPTRRAQVRADAIARLEELRSQCPGLLLVDGHYSLRNRVTGHLGSVVTPEDRAFYDVLILLDATPESVLDQVQKDSRSRPGRELEAIAEHLAFERALAAQTAESMQSPVWVIRAQALPERISALAQLLRPLRGQQ